MIGGMSVKIEGLRIKNFKILKDITLRNLPNMAVFLGANGSGKSTLFDVFGFLHDSLIDNVRAALTKRGGYKEVVSRGQEGPIEFEIKFRPSPGETLVTYELHIGLDGRGLPVVQRELLKYRRGQKGKPWHFLDFSNGVGTLSLMRVTTAKREFRSSGRNKNWIPLISWRLRGWANFRNLNR
jgi:predicted ATPase